MSTYRQPSTLVDIVIDNYGARVQLCAAIMLCDRQETTKYYEAACLRLEREIHCLPIHLADQTTNNMLRHLQKARLSASNDQVRPDLLNMVLKAVIHPKVTFINTDMNMYFSQSNKSDELSYSGLEKLRNLRILRMGPQTGFSYKVQFPENLQELTVENGYVTDAVLMTISETSRQLRCLNINKNSHVTNNAIRFIAGFKYLQILCVANTGITPAGFLKLLIALCKQKINKSLKQIEYHFLRFYHIRFLSRNFPRLRQLTIFQPELLQDQTLATLRQITEVILNLKCDKFNFAHVSEYLRSRIIYMKIVCRKINFTALENLVFPALNNLYLDADTFRFHSELFPVEPLPGYLPIEHLEVKTNGRNEIGLMKLLLRCVNLKTTSIKFCCNRTITNIFSALLMWNKLPPKLEILDCSPGLLTDSGTLDNLPSCCPNLKVLNGVPLINSKNSRRLSEIKPFVQQIRKVQEALCHFCL